MINKYSMYVFCEIFAYLYGNIDGLYISWFNINIITTVIIVVIAIDSTNVVV